MNVSETLEVDFGFGLEEVRVKLPHNISMALAVAFYHTSDSSRI